MIVGFAGVSGYTENLGRFADGPLLHFIDGAPTPSTGGDTFENHSPVDSMLLGTVASGDAADVDLAARAVADSGARLRRLGRHRRSLDDIFADLEQIGYDGAFSFEAKLDPFLPLVLAAENTTHLRLGTAIAIANAMEIDLSEALHAKMIRNAEKYPK